MKKKMNNTLYAINHDLNFLQHDGRPGMKWHTHKFGKWQSQAVYAQGQPNPDTKERKGLKGAVEKVKNAASDAVIKYQAKNDAAYHVINQDRQKTNSKAYRRLAIGRNLAELAGGVAGGTLGYVSGRSLANNNLPNAQNWKLKEPMRITYRMPGYDGNLSFHGNTYNQAKLGAKMASDNMGSSKLATLLNIGKAGAEFTRRATAERGTAITKAGKLGGVLGGVTGAAVAGNAYKKLTYEGYLKRGEGTLMNTKMTPRQQQVYRDTFDKYFVNYLDSTKIHYGKSFGTSHMNS